MAVTKLCEGCGKGVQILGITQAMMLHRDGWFACGGCRERKRRCLPTLKEEAALRVLKR